jgi:antagonist of KipI
MNLFVLDPGLASRIVDMGRPRTRSLGVPVGGAADRAALALGNALVGNPPGAPALEICLKGPVLRAEARLGGVVFGAPFTLASARQALECGKTFTLDVDEEIHLGGTPSGMCAYLCVRGALRVPKILGSCSGLTEVEAGARLECPTASLRRRYFPQAMLDELRGEPSVLRVLPGLQADWFEEDLFYEQQFTVTPELNRMGIRLEGRPLPVPARELVSEPVCPGAVQVTRDGQCILLGVDGQTIGGYPKIAQVIQADLDHVGQLRLGAALRFRKVTLDEAVHLYHQRQEFLREWSMRARVSLDGW